MAKMNRYETMVAAALLRTYAVMLEKHPERFLHRPSGAELMALALKRVYGGRILSERHEISQHEALTMLALAADVLSN